MEFSEIFSLIVIIGSFNALCTCLRPKKFALYIQILVNLAATFAISPFVAIILLIYSFTIYLLFEVSDEASKSVKILLCLLAITVLIVWKYMPSLFNSLIGFSHLGGAFGLSFLTFQYIYILINFSIEVGDKSKHTALARALTVKALSDPHRLIAGPLFNLRKRHQIHPKKNSPLPSLYLNIWIIMYGAILKFSIADNLSAFVDKYYLNPIEFSGIISAVVLLVYNIQILCDFMGFSIIALGLVRLCGNRCTVNFNNPYIAHSFKDFWGRWHISLSTWFRDFIYIPLGGSRISEYRTSVNVLIVMLISGAWHGSTYNFIIWGLMHAFLLICNNNFTFNLPRIFGRLFVFITVTFTWILFRSPNLEIAHLVLKSLNNSNDQIFQNIDIYASYRLVIGLAVAAIVLVIQSKYFRLIKKNLLIPSSRSNFNFFILIPLTYIFLVSTGNFWGSNVIYAGF